MDFTALAAIAGGLKGAIDVGQAALLARDSAKLADAVAEMNNKLLDAQQRLFVLGAEAFALQDELARTKKQALELQTALEERGRYVLAEISRGQLAYKSKIEAAEDGSQPVEPLHYICQPCFDNGRKVTLRYFNSETFGETWTCSVCKAELG
ncbi:MAG: hypothetical protein J0I65_18600 [Variovorax sp.]|nr:hypothetical protein [Variovorax sp.]|tara:strand:- start:255 stop:710 length:456 start_codon:yes stop_codon:yes gene_type:complete